MKKIILALIIITVFGCKNTTKKENEKEKNESYSTSSTQIIHQVVNEIKVAQIDQWDFRGIAMTKTDMLFNNEEIYKMSVTDDVKSSSFIAINNIKIGYTGGKYRISVIVKSNEKNSNFALRIQEVYPIRFDAVFDLVNNKARGTFKKGDFTEEETLSIEELGDGWVKCTISAEIYASYFRLVFGPTSVPEKQTKSWEAESLNNIKREVFIIPSSLKVEELED